MKKLHVYFLISALITLLAALMQHFGLTSRIENASWDYRQTVIADKELADKRIKIIQISQSDLDFYAEEEFQTWPWPRSFFGAMINFLSQAGAKGVVVDILFTEHAVHKVHEDEMFAELASGPITLINAIAGKGSREYSDVEEAQLFAQFQNKQQASDLFYKYLTRERGVLRFPSAALPGTQIMGASDGLGLSSVLPDDDGVLRHFRVGGLIGDIPVFALPFALYASTVKSDRIKLEDYFTEDWLLVPRFYGPRGTYKTYAASDVLASFQRLREEREPSLPLSEFTDAWVFIGATAPGLLDYRPIPISGKYPGVELNATVFDNLLNHSFVKKVSAVSSWIITASLIFVACGIQLFVTSVRFQGALIFFVLAGYVVSSFFAATLGYWVPLALPLLAAVLGVLIALAYQYQSEGKQRRFIKKAFSHYLSPEVINMVVERPESLALGGERRELTIFFSDIAGFTSISEQLDAAQLVSFLNRYLSVMTNIILESGGTLDKYEGDAIIAFWNAPLEVDAHPEVAVRAALKCQEELDRLYTEFRERYGIEVHTRIGIHTGEVNVGNFGSASRFDYTIIGDAANLASRLEGVNKVFGTSILISGSTHRHLSEALICRKVGAVQVVGKSVAVEVFEPISTKHSNLSKLEIFDEALVQFESGDLGQAKLSFKKISDDIVASKYLDRIEEEQDTSNSNWNPVWSLSSK